jgi:hypothetical protein
MLLLAVSESSADMEGTRVSMGVPSSYKLLRDTNLKAIEFADEVEALVFQ